MKRRVVVTGLGAVTGLSCKVEDLWKRICAGESGVGPITLWDVANYKVKFAGEVRDWSTDAYISPKEAKRLDRFTQFALVAAIDAVRDSGIDFTKEDAYIAESSSAPASADSTKSKSSTRGSSSKRPRSRFGVHHPEADGQRGGGPRFDSIRFARPERRRRHGLRQRGKRHRRSVQSHSVRQRRHHDHRRHRSGHHAHGHLRLREHAGPLRTERRSAGGQPSVGPRPRRVRPLRRGRDPWCSKNSNTPRPAARRFTPKLLGYGVSADGGHITQPDEEGKGAAKSMSRPCATPSSIRPDRLHQRPRHQHSARRQSRNGGDEDDLRPIMREEGEHLQHEEPARATCSARAAASNWC
jgi:3-oxoacyl-[acyl-carrier-protein] synthase II